MAQLSLTKVEIERNDLLEESDFTIKASGKAFKILSDGLYKDKIRAIIRELSCNAWDAHVAAGNADTPFDLHLPTYLEPHFTIRDYGIGLSKDDCKYLITKYFESTKTRSNAFIGALGLGAKSPYSYVDSYTIISYFHGMKYTFSAFIGEEDMPKIALMGEEETIEPNGLEISMPVRRDDYSNFADRAAIVLKRFDPIPKMTGAGINIVKEPVELSGEGWRLIRNAMYGRYGYSEGGAVAIMGKIAYPISVDALRGNLTQQQEMLLRYPLEIDFAIGELEFAASREELSYKPGTINSIKNRLNELLVDLPQQFQSKFDNVRSLWEARLIYAELFAGSHSAVRNLIRDLSNAKLMVFTALNETIDSSAVRLKYADYPGLKVTTFDYYNNSPSVLDFNMKEAQYQQHKHSNYEGLTLDIANAPIVWENDLKTGPNNRLKIFTKARQNGYSWLVEGPDAIVAKFLSTLGKPPVHKTSELPVPVRKQSVKVKARVWHTEHHYWKDDNEIEISEDKPGLFMYYARDTAHTEIRKYSNHEFSSLIDMLVEFKIIDKETPIVGLNLKEYEKLKADKETKWQVFGPTVLDKFNKGCMTNTKFIDHVFEQTSMARYKNDYYAMESFKHLQASIANIDVDSPIVDYMKRWIDASKPNKDDLTRNFSKLSGLLNVSLAGLSATGYDFEKKWSEIRERYPMSRLLDWYRLQNNVGIFIDYVNMVEAHKRSGNR